jgi:hypothetical protein
LFPVEWEDGLGEHPDDGGVVSRSDPRDGNGAIGSVETFCFNHESRAQLGAPQKLRPRGTEAVFVNQITNKYLHLCPGQV